MDATTRWETEAMRSSAKKRSGPPKPTAKRSDAKRSSGTWLTLKEAEAATGIPTNTLRKWVRKDTVDSYLESDGELAVRMLRLESVVERAGALGRPINPVASPEPEREPVRVPAEPVVPVVDADTKRAEDVPGADRESVPAEPPEGTMLVPIDAWNKMLSQLGNLHEAGQMLADARERAAKAETEATFLRERLAEIRADNQAAPAVEPVEVQEPVDEALQQEDDSEPDRPTTTYWRYLTTGWRDRKKRTH